MSPLRSRLTPERAEELTLCGVWLKVDMGGNSWKPTDLVRARVVYGPGYAAAPDDRAPAGAAAADKDDAAEIEDNALECAQMDAVEVEERLLLQQQMEQDALDA